MHFFLKKEEIKIALEPMACSTMVINKEGYFLTTQLNLFIVRLLLLKWRVMELQELVNSQIMEKQNH